MAKRGSLSNAVKKPTPPSYRDKPTQEFIPAEATTDEERLQQLENTMLECSRVFATMGKALREINESRLYRIKGFETFDDYCLQEWDISGRRAYQMIDAAKVMENMQDCQQLPSNESQARALVKLPPEKQREVWEAVVKDAPKPHKITAKDLEERAKAYQDPQSQPQGSQNKLQHDPQEQAKNYLVDSMEQPRPTTSHKTNNGSTTPKSTVENKAPKKTTTELLIEIKKKINDKTDNEIILMALEQFLKSIK